MAVIGKNLKWLGLALLIFMVWILMRNTIVSYIVSWTLQYEGVKMQKNEWKEFDLDSVKGETPASLFGGLTKGQSILKYRFELMYPFDGKVGFVGGSDREDTRNMCRENGGLKCREKNETAYLFRTIDDGETFTRQSLGHGIVNNIKKSEESYFLNIHEADTYKDRTLRSDDLGKSWYKLGDFRIEAMFDKDKFIYSITKVISIGNRKKTFFYSKDGGKTSQPLDKKILDYEKKSLTNRLEIYKGELVFLIEETLVFVNIDTLEEKRIYGLKQESIWYPFLDTLVVFDKLPEELVLLHVRGNYIGGLLRYRGLLTHIWTMDKGNTWEFEMLSHYFWNTTYTGYGNRRIYMDALVQGKDGVKKGTYLIMGKIK